MTTPGTEVTRPARWDEPLDPGMSDASVERILSVSPFSEIDEATFSKSFSLRGILRNDCRIRSFQEGDIVVRQADYGNTAFFVLDGELRVVLGGDDNELPAEVLGRLVSRKKGLYEAIQQLWKRSRHPEVRHLAAAGTSGVSQRGGDGTGDVRIFLQDVPGVLDEHRTATLRPGEFFGEIAALSRTPRTSTVFAVRDALVVEIRWQGLRDIRRRSEAIRRHVDALYRENSLRSQLRATPIFHHLSADDLARVTDETVFETFGEFEWFQAHRKLSDKTYAKRLAHEPVISHEGEAPHGIFLVRGGFARLSRKYNHGHRTLRYLGKGDVYGLEELVHNWKHDEKVPYRSTLRAVGYVDTLMIPTRIIETVVLPTLPQELLPPPVAESRDQPEAPPGAWMEFLGERRFVNGKAAMLINLDQCVRCDDCVKACAVTHDNNPRFVREGPQLGSLQVANACMHCVDPVCMIGCPTGAIHRDEQSGDILINDRTCIGCSTCANSCPYENIQMVTIRDSDGQVLVDSKLSKPLMKATKCDLCSEQPSGPACVMACSHDALRRVDLNDWSVLASWIGE